MAGGTSSEDNPVHINVVPLVDIIFCLCVFFFCSFHFRQLEGKMESWLPKDKGVNTTPVKQVMVEEVRIFLKYNRNATSIDDAVIRQVGAVVVGSDDELRVQLQANVERFKKLGLPEVPVIIDGEKKVPWREIVQVLSLCQMEGLRKVEFAAPHF